MERVLTANGVDVTVVPVGAELRGSVGISRDDQASYTAAAESINAAGCDAVLVEHEFGIFGGESGRYVLDLVHALTVPYVVTLHTVLPRFAASQLAVLAPLCEQAAAVTVFTTTARRLLLDQQLVSPGALHIVAHGAPVEMYAPIDKDAVRERFELPVRGPVMSTFGLLSEGKGIELAVWALAKLVTDRPDIRYVIAGGTHPEVVRYEGERYRNSLQALVTELGLEQQVVFVDRFLDVDELAELLGITDVFCTPYRGPDQIVSGALTFALAAGCPVVSTPYRYARDMLAGGAGLLVDFGDSDGFASAIARLLDDGPERAAARDAACRAAMSLSWPRIGAMMRSVLTDVTTRRRVEAGSALTGN